MTASYAEALAADPAEAERVLSGLDEDQAAALLADWAFFARPEQQAPPGLWRWWGIVTGRGFGKNRSASEWVADRAEAFAAARHPHLIGLLHRSFGDARATQIAGDSGLKAVCDRRGHKLDHAPTSTEGALIVGYRTPSEHVSRIEIHTANEPDRIRGRNFHSAWGDELAAWRQIVDDQGNTAFTNLDLALRAICPDGMVPQACMTGTPKPIALIKQLLAGELGPTVISRGTLFDNLANLSTAYVEAILRRYANTRLSAQEIMGLVIDSVEGALWNLLGIEADRLRSRAPALARIAIGVDPPAEQQAECGIVVVGLGQESCTADHRTALEREEAVKAGRPLVALGAHRHAYVLADYSIRGASEEWAREVARAVTDWTGVGVGQAIPTVVAEVNNGGDMVRGMIHGVDPDIRVEKVRATDGKATRATPVSLLADQHRWHHVGVFGELEEQMVTWVPGDPTSPDRVDAAVWAGSWLLPEITRRVASAASPVGQGGMSLPRAGR